MMSLDKKTSSKLTQQYELAELQKKLLIHELYQLIDELENRPRIQKPYPFPYNRLAKGINSILDLIEHKYLRSRWARNQSRLLM
jgi:hypothetical protein